MSDAPARGRGIVRRFATAACTALAVTLASAGTVGTTAASAAPPPAPAPAAAGDPWDSTPYYARSFIVKAVSVKAVDETGPNWPLSDEIFVGVRTTQQQSTYVPKAVFERQSRLFGNFDAGQTRTFAGPQSCLSRGDLAFGPSYATWYSAIHDHLWRCDPAGIKAPFTVHATAWDMYTDSVGRYYPERDPLDRYHLGDAPVGQHLLNFSEAGLANDLRYVGASRTYALPFKQDGHYVLTIQVERVANSGFRAG